MFRLLRGGALGGKIGEKIAKSSTKGSARKGAKKPQTVKVLSSKLDHSRDVEALGDYIDALITQDNPDAEYPEDPTDYTNEKMVTCKNEAEKRTLVKKWLTKAINNTEKRLRELKEGGANDSHWEVGWYKDCTAYYKDLKKALG